MYDKDRFCQLGLEDFNQPLGLKMNPENRWVKKAAMIPWKEIEENTAGFSDRRQTGVVSKLGEAYYGNCNSNF